MPIFLHAFRAFEWKEPTQSAPPIRRWSRPYQARRADHAPQDGAAVNLATFVVTIPPAPLEVKAEAEAVDVVKEEALSDVELGEAWPPLPPLDPRQAFKVEEEKVDVGVVASVVAVAAPSTARRSGRPRGSKNSPTHPWWSRRRLPVPNLGMSVKTLRMRRQ